MDKQKKKLLIENELCWQLVLRKLKADIPVGSQKELDRFKAEAQADGSLKLVFHGTEAELSEFLNDNRHALEASIKFAYGKDIVFSIEASGSKEKRTAAKKIRQDKKNALKKVLIALIPIITIAVVSGFFLLGSKDFKETFYQIGSSRISEDIRIALISDLYGEDTNELERRIELLDPDLICVSGDMIDSSAESADRIVSFLSELSVSAPVYYVFGEKEEKQYPGIDNAFRLFLEGNGINVLYNESELINIGGTSIELFGLRTNEGTVTDISQEGLELYKTFIGNESNGLKIVLTHAPYIIEDICAEGTPDLILCGHTLGGYVNIPGAGALFDKEYGWLPERLSGSASYIGGRYELNNCNVIVSRGLANDGLPRINNDPELVIIDVFRY